MVVRLGITPGFCYSLFLKFLKQDLIQAVLAANSYVSQNNFELWSSCLHLLNAGLQMCWITDVHHSRLNLFSKHHVGISLILFLFYVCASFVCVCLVPLKVGGGVTSPGPGVTEGCETMWGLGTKAEISTRAASAQPQRQLQLPYNLVID